MDLVLDKDKMMQIQAHGDDKCAPEQLRGLVKLVGRKNEYMCFLKEQLRSFEKKISPQS